MAEVVGVVVGVVSLGVQLAESVQKVKRFYNDVKDAPERLADVINGIESLSDFLIDLEGSHSSDGTGVSPNTQRCIAACRKAVDRFSTYVNGLESRLKRSKRRGSVKIALKSESIEGGTSRLESSKSNLVLAYVLFREAISDKRAACVQNQMAAVVNNQAVLLQRTPFAHDTQLISRNHEAKAPATPWRIPHQDSYMTESNNTGDSGKSSYIRLEHYHYGATLSCRSKLRYARLVKMGISALSSNFF